jgi:acetate---CoA ligase (ADP-forming)
MLTLRKNEVRDKYSGDVIGEITQDTRRDLRAKIHRAFNAKDAARSMSFEERAEFGRRVGRLLTIHRGELEELMVREAGQPRKFARWELERAIATATNLDKRLQLLASREVAAASGRNVIYREPYGLAGVIPPRNTPLVVPVYTMLAALGGGNAVIEGALLQEQLARAAAETGIRIIGPNCQGANYPSHGLRASWPLIKKRGAMAIASQSGTVGAALADWASEEGLGFSAFVSMGNRLDVDEADLIEFFAHDPNTKVITLYIEGVKDAKEVPRRGEVVPEADRDLQGGADGAGAQGGGVAHALAGGEGRDLRRGVPAVRHPPRALARGAVRRVEGAVLIVTSSGGSAIIATDVAEENGYRVAPLPDPLAARLREILPAHCIVGNPLDLTGDTDAARYQKVMAEARGHYDVVTTIFGDPIPGASAVLDAGAPDLVVYLGGADVERTERKKLHEKGIAVFPTPERGVTALAAYNVKMEDRHSCLSPCATEQGTGKSACPPFESFAFLQAEGFDVVRSKHATSEDAAVAAARAIGYPVVLKLNALDVTHKSGVGGVHLNLKTDDDVRAAFQKIATIEAQHAGILVSAMAAPGREVIVGVTRDLQFGHAVMFGLGGTLVEVLRKASFRLVPFGGNDAEALIGEIAEIDNDALKKLLVQVSELVVRHPEIEEMDLNPVIVHEKGLTIVDARIVRPSQS